MGVCFRTQVRTASYVLRPMRDARCSGVVEIHGVRPVLCWLCAVLQRVQRAPARARHAHVPATRGDAGGGQPTQGSSWRPAPAVECGGAGGVARAREACTGQRCRPDDDCGGARAKCPVVLRSGCGRNGCRVGHGGVVVCVLLPAAGWCMHVRCWYRRVSPVCARVWMVQFCSCQLWFCFRLRVLPCRLGGMCC